MNRSETPSGRIDFNALLQARKNVLSGRSSTKPPSGKTKAITPVTTTTATSSPDKKSIKELFAKRKPAFSDEWNRIQGLPRVDDMDPSEVDWLHLDKEKVSLRPIQGKSLAMIQKYKGLFGPIGVGHGKSLIAWLAPVVLGNLRAVIMMPPPMVEAFKVEIAKFKDYFRCPREEPIIVPYSILSAASGTALLRQIRPQVIIADEGHALMSEDSARTKRLLRYFAEFPDTIFITLSGTFFGKTPSKLAHLVRFSLGDNAFMPVQGDELSVWGRCIDLDGRPNDSDWKAFAPLAKAEGVDIAHARGEERNSLARKAMYLRMTTTPGVVSTIEASFGAPLHVHRHDHNEIVVPEEVEQALVRVLSDEETPDGDDVIVDDAQRARLQNYLSCGFYYRWAWEKVGGKDHEWILARKVWHKALRRELERNSKEGYDSPLLVSNALDRQLLVDPSLVNKRQLHAAYNEWKQQRNKPVPPTEAVWISDFYLKWVEQFLSDGIPTVCWYSSKAMENALAQILPVYGVGTTVPSFAGKSVAASIPVHGEGKNGWQPWYRALLIEPPTSSKRMEQLLGRQHRPGQEHDFVEVHIPTHTAKYRKNLDGVIKGAYHTKELSGVDQRILLARFM